MPPNCQYSISAHSVLMARKKIVESDVSDKVPVNLNDTPLDSIDYKRCNLPDRAETGAPANFTDITENIKIQFIIIYTSHRL